MTATASHAQATPDELAGRIFSSVINAMEVYCIYVGDRLGFYHALREGGPLTAAELAARRDERALYAGMAGTTGDRGLPRLRQPRGSCQ